MSAIAPAVGVAASLALAGGMVASRLGQWRFWPPGERDWRWATYLALAGVATLALLVAAARTWNGAALPRPASLAAGSVLLAVGVVGFVGATLDLGVEETSGMAGQLRTGGYYRYTRNPQLCSLLVVVAGAVLAANSWAVLAVGAGMACWFVAMPFAEEPWLRAQYGSAYERYCREVPRFVGRTTVVRLVETLR